jgi:hypothetical protein
LYQNQIEGQYLIVHDIRVQICQNSGFNLLEKLHYVLIDMHWHDIEKTYLKLYTRVSLDSESGNFPEESKLQAHKCHLVCIQMTVPDWYKRYSVAEFIGLLTYADTVEI